MSYLMFYFRAYRGRNNPHKSSLLMQYGPTLCELSVTVPAVSFPDVSAFFRFTQRKQTPRLRTNNNSIPTVFKQARVNPLLKKPALNTSLIENYRPVSPSIHSVNTRTICLRPGLIVSFTKQQTGR